MVNRLWRSCRSVGVALLAVVGLLAAFVMPGGGSAAAATSGGSLTVLSNTTQAWHSLDPALGTGFIAFPYYMDAIYGDLFEQGPNNQPIPDLATGYKISKDGKAVTISLRHGVKFTDGTPFNAAAVKFNIDRDLAPSSGDACACSQNYPIGSVTTQGQYAVVLHLTKAFAPIIEAFFQNVGNWIASPTALTKEGPTEFAINPVGAGPFKVKKNTVGVSLQLVKNPNYWAKGKPRLNSLTFQTIGSEQSGYEALQSGTAQAYLRVQTVSIAEQAKKKFTVALWPNVSPLAVQLNVKTPPFNNKLAREAIYYATNVAPINQALFDGLGVMTQSLTGPQSLLFESKVPGYRTYNLAKAKALVKQLGGLNVTILDSGAPVSNNVMTALKAEWSEAGIQTTLDEETLATYIQRELHGQWSAALQGVGGLDPALGTGLALRFLSTGSMTGEADPTLDKLINAGAAELNAEKRAAIYRQAYKRISDQAYAAMLFTQPQFNITTHNVSGTGLTTSPHDPAMLWEDVAIK